MGDPGDEVASLSQASGMSVEDHWVDAKAVPMAPVRCVVERPFEVFVLGKVLGGGVVALGLRAAVRGQDATAKSQASRIMFFASGIQTSAAGSWLARTETCLLGGFTEDMRDRIMSGVAISSRT